jgi:hypothetical protein
MSMQHTVVFSLSHERGSAEEADFIRWAHDTLTSIEFVKDFVVNEQVSAKSDFTWQFSMVFADQTEFERYNTHPTHVALVESRWAGEVTSFQELDFVVKM